MTFSYLSTSSKSSAQTKYTLNVLQAKLDELRQINETTLSFIRALSADDVGPLIFELFEMQQ